MKYKSTIFNILIVISTIITGILIANKIYYKSKDKVVEDITYIHVENNITPFVFNKIIVPQNTINEDTLNKDKIEEKQESTKESKSTDKDNISAVKKGEEKSESKTFAEIPELQSNIVFDGLTMEQLVIKLNNNMKNELSNMGQLYAEYSLALGVDPYVALAITLQETGCSWNCSTLVKNCNNVGGQKGTPRCGNGSYKKYDTLEEGIKGYLNNLSDNYYKQGLNTPELINTRYATSTDWSTKINNYVEKIKSN